VRATVSLNRGLLSDATRTRTVRAMGATPQEHAVARRFGGHPALPLIAEPRHSESTYSACSPSGSRASALVADYLDLGGWSPKGLSSRASSPQRPGARASPKVGSPRT